MNLQHKLNILFSIVILALIITILIILLSENKMSNEQTDINKIKEYQLMEFNQAEEISIYGLVTPSIIEEVKMNVDGKIDENNRTLKAGSQFKKNEILIKVERLNALYELLAARSEYKSLIQKLIISIDSIHLHESKKWKQFESRIQKTISLPDLPVIKSKDEEKIIHKYNIVSEYYKTKKIEKKIEDYIYLAPFDGTIIESSIGNGQSVQSGETILRLAKKNSYHVVGQSKLKELEKINNADTVLIYSLENEILSKGKLLRIGTTLLDSSKVKVYYSILSQNQTHLNQPVKIKYLFEKTKIPTHAIENDSVQLFLGKKIYKTPINIIDQVKDSATVEGLPNQSYVIINP